MVRSRCKPPRAARTSKPAIARCVAVGAQLHLRASNAATASPSRYQVFIDEKPDFYDFAQDMVEKTGADVMEEAKAAGFVFGGRPQT